jgi:proteasome accessory factor B
VAKAGKTDSAAAEYPDFKSSVDSRDNSERLLGLTFALIDTKIGLTKSEIFRTVPGYQSGESADALEQMFNRDKRAIRTLGVKIQAFAFGNESNQDTRYRIAREGFEWPNGVKLSAKQLQLIELAAQCWGQATVSNEVNAALMRLRALGDAPTSQAVHELMPKFRALDPTITDFGTAISERQTVTFEYRKPGTDMVQKRVIHPWRLLSVEGQWLVQGWDPEANDYRNFLLKRIVNKRIKLTDFETEAEKFSAPTEQQLAEAQANLDNFRSANVAVLTVVPGSAAWSHFELDLKANPASPDQVSLNYMDESLLAETIRGFAGQIRVNSPASLAEKVAEGLRRVAQLHA